MVAEMTAAGENVLGKLVPAKLSSLRSIMAKEFPFACLKEANSKFLSEVRAVTINPAAGSTGVNAQVVNIREIVRDELAALVENLLQIEVWITLSIPKISDGNNYGVEVQEHICKLVVAKKDAAKTLLDGMNTYNTERAGLWEKAVFPVTEKKSGSKGHKKATGGEKNTDEHTESEDVATAHSRVCDDAVAAIAWLDAQEYFKMKMLVTESWKTYATILDQLSKNIDKVKDPRGEGSGGGDSISMF